MRHLIAVLALVFITAPASTLSLKDFNAKPAADRSAYVADFIDNMTTDPRAKHPENNPAATKAVARDVASTNKPPMVIQNPDGTITVRKESPKGGAKDTEAKKGLVIPPQVVVPTIPTPEKRN